jgi:hypothetical protein
VPIDKELRGSQCDFSMISFLNEGDHMQLIKHAIGSDEKATLERILKTAAVVQTITSRYGNYHSVEKVARRHRAVPRPTGPSA